jgi:hypothetical protein
MWRWSSNAAPFPGEFRNTSSISSDFRYFFVASLLASVYKNRTGRASATNTDASLTNVTYREATMADPDVTRKLFVYRALYRLNRAFTRVNHNLDQLLISQVFKEDVYGEGFPHGWQEQIAQIQGEINRRLTEDLHRMEHGDIRQLARIQAMDEQLRERHYPSEKPARRKARG